MKIVKKSAVKKNVIPMKKKVEPMEDTATSEFKKQKESIDKMVNEYKFISEQEKELKKKKDSLSKAIKLFSMENGAKTDNGFILDNTEFEYGVIIPKSVIPKSNIIDLLKNSGHGDLVKEVVTEVVDEDGLTGLWKKGDVDSDFIDSLYEEKAGSPRIFVNKIENSKDMPEVLKTAAKKRR